MLTVDQTTRSYSGLPGCMCGCKGTYNESERARKMAITALLKSPLVRYDSWGEGAEGRLVCCHCYSQSCALLDSRGRENCAGTGRKARVNYRGIG